MSYLNLILLSSTWSLSHRKGLYTHLRNGLSEWSTVIFLESPFSILVHTIKRIKEVFTVGNEKEKKNNNIRTFRPVIIFHHKIWNKIGVTLKIDAALLGIQIKRFVEKEGCSKLIIWAAYPFDYPVIKRINPDFVIYDFYDNFSYDEDGSYNSRRDNFNKNIILESSLIFCTALKLYEFAKVLNPNAYYLPNGHNLFFSGSEEKADLNINGKIIGFLGNIRHWIDFDLIKELAVKLRSDQYLVFIGPVERGILKEINLLKKNKQFRYLGSVRYDQVYSYIKNFDIGIIPFRINSFMEGVFPNKFFEYIACGVKIVSTNLPDMKQYKESINVAENNSQFIQMCLSEDYKLNFDKEMYNKIKSESSWDLRANFMNKKTKEIISGK